MCQQIVSGDLRLSHYLHRQVRQAVSKSSLTISHRISTHVGFWVRQTRAWALALHFTTFWTLGKLLNLPEPSFPVKWQLKYVLHR